MENKKSWFDDWFNTSYYHLLYNHRNDKEAQLFMHNLTSFLQLPPSTSILDLACGKGRHAVYLNSLGYTVFGADLSSESIQHAQQFSNSTLSFFEKDMREPFGVKVDAVFNLFTSFGYFEDDLQDIQVLKNITEALKPGGVAVIDYLNVGKTIPNLVAEEVVQRGELNFYIKRSVQNGFIIKDIQFTDGQQSYHFTERVKVIDLTKFKNYCAQAGLKINHIFGNYNLQPFEESNSDRLILIVTQ